MYRFGHSASGFLPMNMPMHLHAFVQQLPLQLQRSFLYCVVADTLACAHVVVVAGHA